MLPRRRVFGNSSKKRARVGYVSAISFNNAYYVARWQEGSDKALGAIRLVCAVFQVVPLDAFVIDEALAVPGRDFEDAIHAATAVRIAADYVVTRNVSHYDSTRVALSRPRSCSLSCNHEWLTPRLLS